MSFLHNMMKDTCHGYFFYQSYWSIVEWGGILEYILCMALQSTQSRKFRNYGSLWIHDANKCYKIKLNQKDNKICTLLKGLIFKRYIIQWIKRFLLSFAVFIMPFVIEIWTHSEETMVSIISRFHFHFWYNLPDMKEANQISKIHPNVCH